MRWLDETTNGSDGTELVFALPRVIWSPKNFGSEAQKSVLLALISDFHFICQKLLQFMRLAAGRGSIPLEYPDEPKSRWSYESTERSSDTDGQMRNLRFHVSNSAIGSSWISSHRAVRTYCTCVCTADAVSRITAAALPWPLVLCVK